MQVDRPSPEPRGLSFALSLLSGFATRNALVCYQGGASRRGRGLAGSSVGNDIGVVMMMLYTVGGQQAIVVFLLLLLLLWTYVCGDDLTVYISAVDERLNILLVNREVYLSRLYSFEQRGFSHLQIREENQCDSSTYICCIFWLFLFNSIFIYPRASARSSVIMLMTEIAPRGRGVHSVRLLHLLLVFLLNARIYALHPPATCV